MTTGGDAPSTGAKAKPLWDQGWSVWGVVASLIGVQGLVASGALSSPVLMLLPTGGPMAQANDGLRRGYALAMEEARTCDVQPPTTELGWVPPGQDPRPLFVGRTIPNLLIAPAAVSLLPYGLLAEASRMNVLFPLQRGESVQELPGQPGADQLWPVLPARSLEADRLARGLNEQDQGKAMVIHDGSLERMALAERFTETLTGGKGWVVGPTNGPLEMATADDDAIEQLLDDVSWYKPDSLVVMAAPGSALARAVADADWPANLTLVWPFPVESPLATAQLGVESLSRGVGWSRFAEAFERRFGFQPGLVEAAGYDTGQLTVLAAQTAQTAEAGGRDQAWQLNRLDAKAEPLPLCAALEAVNGESPLAVEGAASRLDLSPGLPPSAEFQLTPLGAAAP